MRQLPQQEHCDLGLIDDDRTPDMSEEPRLHPRPFDSEPTHPVMFERQTQQ